MNNILIAGHLGADPETRFTSGGKKVTTLRVAARVRKNGKDETIWWRVTIWGDQFDKMLPHLKKGSPIIVYGELAMPEIYNDREGKPQVSMNITAFSLQFSPFGRSEGHQQQTGSQPVMQNASPQAAAPAAASSSYTPPSMQQNSAPSSDMGMGTGNQTSSFDDEVPF